MNLDIVVHVEKYTQRLLAVTIDVQAGAGEHCFALQAFVVGNGISLLNWQVTSAECRLDGTQICITGTNFRIQYDIEVLHEVCLGSSRDVDFLYPFLNPNEVFFGTGLLPVPQEEAVVTFRLQGLPEGWQEFSSLTPGGMHVDKLSAFFCYCAPQLKPAGHVHQGQKQDVALNLLVQSGKTLPVPAQALFDFFDKYMHWLEESLAPYQRAAQIHFLILQAPPDFAERAQQRTFASGENVLNGIACYAPADTEYLKSYFGYTSYAQCIYEGLAHELLHFYTSAAFEARQKSVLYPSPDCTSYAIRLLGDALNVYFYSQYVSEHVPEARGAFETRIARAIARQEKTGQRQPLLDLQTLDAYLQENHSSLLALFRAMLVRKLADRTPYESASFLFETMRTQLKISPPEELERAVLLQS